MVDVTDSQNNYYLIEPELKPSKIFYKELISIIFLSKLGD